MCKLCRGSWSKRFVGNKKLEFSKQECGCECKIVIYDEQKTCKQCNHTLSDPSDLELEDYEDLFLSKQGIPIRTDSVWSGQGQLET